MMARVILKLFLCLSLGLALTGPAQARSSTQTAFSPSPEAIKLVVKTINQAKASIDVAAYSFTSKPVSEALLAAHRRGAAVRILLDKSQGKRHYKAAEVLREAGIPIRINRRYAIMHNKYIIIDGKTVETGSFNYTANAEKRNAENVIVIKNNEKVAKAYMENWEKLWNEGEAYAPNSQTLPEAAAPETVKPETAKTATAPAENKFSSRMFCKIVRAAFEVFYPHTWRSYYSPLCESAADMAIVRLNECDESAAAPVPAPNASFLNATTTPRLRRPCFALEPPPRGNTLPDSFYEAK